MKPFTLILSGIVLVALVGGFAYVAFRDIPVNQTEIVKQVPQDRFHAAQAN